METPSVQRRSRFIEVALLCAAVGLVAGAFVFDQQRQTEVDASSVHHFEWFSSQRENALDLDAPTEERRNETAMLPDGSETTN